MRYLIALILLELMFVSANGQQKNDYDFDGFQQTIDVSPYQKCLFRLKAFVRAEYADKLSNARLWARVANKKQVGYFDNMVNRPIMDSVWREYVIEGEIGAGMQSMVIGGLYFGFGKYYYDNFALEIKLPNEDWKIVPIINGEFENLDMMSGWKWLFHTKGYKTALSKEVVVGGSQALLIDGTDRSSLSFGSNRKAGKYVDANNIRLYYEEYGEGEPLLLLHGNGQSIRDFKNQIPEFAKRYHVIVLDSRGQGNSTEDQMKLTYELMAKDVNDFLDVLNLKNVNVMGWSDGGNTGLIMAMKYPDKIRKLAVMGANLYNDASSVDQKINKQFRDLRKTMENDSQSENVFSIQLIDLALNEPNIKAEDLKAIKCPVLVMAGSKDIIKEAHTKLIASSIENSILVIFKNGTHMEPQENPVVFNNTVLEFLIH